MTHPCGWTVAKKNTVPGVFVFPERKALKGLPRISGELMLLAACDIGE